MKVVWHDVWEVSFSLGRNPNNVAMSFRLLGEPTLEMIAAYLEARIRPYHIHVMHNFGLPHSDPILTFYQCLFLLREQGMPELGLAKQYMNMMKDISEPAIVGHLSIMKVDSVKQVVDVS